MKTITYAIRPNSGRQTMVIIERKENRNGMILSRDQTQRELLFYEESSKACEGVGITTNQWQDNI